MHSTITARNSRRSNLTRWLIGLVAALSMSVAFAAPAQAADTSAQDLVCVPTGGYPVCVGVGYECGPYSYSICVRGLDERLAATLKQLEDGYWKLHWMVYPYRKRIACAIDPGSCD